MLNVFITDLMFILAYITLVTYCTKKSTNATFFPFKQHK